MIDTNKELEWLQEWVNDPADEGTTNLEVRKWTTSEVETIMHIYSSKVVENNVALHNVSNQRELLITTLICTIDDLLPEDHWIRLSNSYRKLK